jgi:membrane fusion protein (multidrug efflux system)
MRSPVILFSALFILNLLVFNSCKSKKNEPGGQQGASKAVTVGGIVVQPRLLENRISSTGTLEANEEVQLRSEMPGRIISISFEEGTLVRKDQILVKINDQELQAQLKKLQLEKNLAQDDVYRKQKLLELKAVSQEEYDKSANQLGIIDAQIELLKSQIAKTEIYAPFNGMIGLRHVSPGEYVSSSTPVALLIQGDPIKIEFSIPEKYRDKLKKGTPIRFTVEGVDSTFTGKVFAFEPKVDPSTRNVTVRAICPNPQNLLVPGSFAKVMIVLESIPGAMVIPSEAIIPQLNGEKVFVSSQGKAVSRIVTTGIRTEREVEVTGGLAPGDTVILTGLLQIREGMDIRIKLPKSE